MSYKLFLNDQYMGPVINLYEVYDEVHIKPGVQVVIDLSEEDDSTIIQNFKNIPLSDPRHDEYVPIAVNIANYDIAIDLDTTKTEDIITTNGNPPTILYNAVLYLVSYSGNYITFNPDDAFNGKGVLEFVV